MTQMSSNLTRGPHTTFKTTNTVTSFEAQRTLHVLNGILVNSDVSYTDCKDLGSTAPRTIFFRIKKKIAEESLSDLSILSKRVRDTVRGAMGKRLYGPDAPW